MLVVVMIETQEGVKNALEIASQPGVDVVIIGNADFESFSGFAPASEVIWGNANPGFSRNNPLAADSRFHLGVPPVK